jgi:hypothetical protein
LLSFIGLSHGNDGPAVVPLGVDHDHGAASKQSNADDSVFTIISPAIRELDGRAGEDGLGIAKIQASLLQRSQTLGRVKADHRAGSAG